MSTVGPCHMAFSDVPLVARLRRGFLASLRAKLLLPLVFVIAALTVATLFVVRHFAEIQAQAQIEQEVSNAILTVQAALNQRELALNKKADHLAIVAYIRNGDPSAIDDASNNNWQSNECDLFAITDAKGKILSVHSTAVGFSSVNAKELLERSLKQPQIKVIYVSGYLDYQQSANEFVEGALFIQKPFTRTTLVTRMAEALKEVSEALA